MYHIVDKAAQERQIAFIVPHSDDKRVVFHIVLGGQRDIVDILRNSLLQSRMLGKLQREQIGVVVYFAHAVVFPGNRFPEQILAVLLRVRNVKSAVVVL